MRQTLGVVAAAVLTMLVAAGCTGVPDDPVAGGSATSTSVMVPVGSTTSTVEPPQPSPGSATGLVSTGSVSTATTAASASGTLAPTIDEQAAQRISDDLADALTLMHPSARYNGFTFFHTATLLQQLGLAGHVATADTETMIAFENGLRDFGYVTLDRIRMYPDAPFNGTDVVWQLEAGQGSPDPVIYRLGDEVDFPELIDFFVEHDFDRTDRADGSVVLASTAAPLGNFFHAVVYPDRQLLVNAGPDFTLPDADDSAAGTELAELAELIGPGVLVSAVAGTHACTDPSSAQVAGEAEPSARASAASSIAQQAQEHPLATITAAAVATNGRTMVALGRYPDADSAARDLGEREFLLESGSFDGVPYREAATIGIEVDGDLLRYTVEPVGDHGPANLMDLSSGEQAPWRICR